ncbi:amastin-like protein [Leptomonas pyrrhocoris]|uniref:Amastin-like protein n=1 Tax=Leptomonas pyrrhocoris TaxID=157538 RepID=A0A0N0DZE7_LEPPY|nr:amastin-like protein [Leptomonas pyrrhocoris]XP_015663654.1 amastin-like protein [Leptomonas pyrrhocoris]KPA85214.1 amastin-like protein [Leptomonas pyrrhocoris]KPA85215.1 amastin-like protein [Leptomonas pyrrhocoris]|eukprot:XP_015663653.1 amastin-like protein [Leptomonas pyrrhocoris]
MSRPQQQQEYPEEEQSNEEQRQQENHQPVEEDVNSHSSKDSEVKNSKPKAEGEQEKEKKKPKFSVGVLLFAIFIFVAFVLSLAGMTLGMMDKRGSNACISIWGYKPKCTGSWFRHIDFKNFENSGRECKKGDSLMQGAQAFSVMCLIGGFMTTGVALLELFHFAELAVVACIISSISMISTLVVWSTMLAYYWADLCGIIVYADTYKIGNGLILFITAWCLQMVASLILMIDIYLGNSK